MTLPAGAPLVSIIVPVFNLWDYTRKCLEAIARHTGSVAHEVIVVDDASTDETPRELERWPHVRVIRNETNRGFSRNNNAAAAIARGKYLCFLNNDTEVHAGWLAELVRTLESDPAIGMVGCKLLFPDGTIQHAGVAVSYGVSDPIQPSHVWYKQPSVVSLERRDVSAVTAACALMPRDLFTEVGGFDEGYLMGYEDVDLCFKVRQRGRRIVYTPDAVVTHHESISEGRFVANRRNIERLHDKWLGRYEAFDFDVRRFPRPPLPPSDRPGVSVVVVACDELATIAPCLENLVLDLRAQDEMVIVDDGSRGATGRFVQQFAQRHSDRVRHLRNPVRVGFQAAARAGLIAAQAPYAALLPPTLRLLPGSFDRLVAHLRAHAEVGVVCPSEADGWNLSREVLVVASPPNEPRLALPSPRAAERTRLPASACFVGERTRLLACVQQPGALLGDDPGVLSDVLASAGLLLAAASDVPVYSLSQTFPSSGSGARTAYLDAVSRFVRSGVPPTSIVIVARDHGDVLERCLGALTQNVRGDVELIVVDDGSREALADVVAAARIAGRAARFVRNEAPLGFARASNQGIVAAKGSIVVVMNGDVIVTRGWLERLCATLHVNASVGIAGPCSNVGPGPQLVGGLDLGPEGPTTSLDAFADERQGDAWSQFGGAIRLPGCCLALRRELIDRIGGFDPRYGDDGGDADDLCLRATRAGFRVALAYAAYVHREGPLPTRHLGLHPKRPAPRGWTLLCERWRHPPDARSSEAIAALFRSGTFDAARDKIPVDAADPLKLATAARHRVLAWPRVADARALAETFGPSLVDRPDVCLCLRHDRTRDGDLATASAAIEAAFAARFGPAANVEALFIDDELDDAGWAALGRAVTHVLALPSSAEPDRAAALARLGHAPLASGEELRLALGGASSAPPTVSHRRAPAVSVIMPTYDRPDLLARAIDSLTRQTFTDFEVVVVNDAGRSIDDVIDRYRRRIDVTTVRHGTNRDRSAARNTGLRTARGGIIAYLDDDDWYRPEHLAVLVETLRRGPNRVVYSDTLMNHEERIAGGYRVVGSEPMPSQDFSRDLLLVRNYIPVLALAHERSCLDEIGGGFDEELATHEDWELFIRLALRFDFTHVRQVTAEFSMRRDGSSTTSSRRPDFARTAAIIYGRHRDAVKDRPDLQLAQAQFLGAMLPHAQVA